MSLAKGLAHQRQAGIKKAKAHFTLAVCCNTSGTDPLPPWFIRTSGWPWAFRAARVNVYNMPYEWQHNGSAWMTGQIMAQYLYWFNRRMAGRSVLLLLDNFSAYKLAMKCIEDVQPL